MNGMWMQYDSFYMDLLSLPTDCPGLEYTQDTAYDTEYLRSDISTWYAPTHTYTTLVSYNHTYISVDIWVKERLIAVPQGTKKSKEEKRRQIHSGLRTCDMNFTPRQEAQTSLQAKAWLLEDRMATASPSSEDCAKSDDATTGRSTGLAAT